MTLSSIYREKKYGEVVNSENRLAWQTRFGDIFTQMFGEGSNITLTEVVFDGDGKYLSDRRCVFGGGDITSMTGSRLKLEGSNLLDGTQAKFEVMFENIKDVGTDAEEVKSANLLKFGESLDGGKQRVIFITKNKE